MVTKTICLCDWCGNETCSLYFIKMGWENDPRDIHHTLDKEICRNCRCKIEDYMDVLLKEIKLEKKRKAK